MLHLTLVKPQLFHDWESASISSSPEMELEVCRILGGVPAAASKVQHAQNEQTLVRTGRQTCRFPLGPQWFIAFMTEAAPKCTADGGLWGSFPAQEMASPDGLLLLVIPQQDSVLPRA